MVSLVCRVIGEGEVSLGDPHIDPVLVQIPIERSGRVVKCQFTTHN